MKYFIIFLILIGFIGSAFALYGAVPPTTTHPSSLEISNQNEETIIPPPLKQMQIGIKLGHIICDEDKIPTWNVHYKPACVFPDSENKLLKRGWAKLRLMLPASGDPIKELEWTGQNEVTYRILGNLRVGDEPPPSTLDEKRAIAWEHAQKYHPGERFLEYSIPTSGMYHFNLGEKIQFEIMEWGNYFECWDLNVRIFNTNNDILYKDTLNKGCLEPDGKPGWFSSYSVEKDSEIICEKPGYYMIEVSNGEIFPPTILQNFVCLNKSKSVSLTEQFKDIPEVEAFYAKYPDAYEEVRSDHVSYVVGSDDGFKVRMKIYFDENYELDYIDMKCYVNRELQNDIPETFILKYLQKYECEKRPTPPQGIWVERPSVQCEDPLSENFEQYGLHVLGHTTIRDTYQGMRCEACGCLGWDTLYLHILPEDLHIAESLGWKLSEGPNE